MPGSKCQAAHTSTTGLQKVNPGPREPCAHTGHGEPLRLEQGYQAGEGEENEVGEMGRGQTVKGLRC